MQHPNRKHTKALFGSVLAIMLLPAIQQYTGIIHEAPLKGAIVKPEKPALSIMGWFSAEYQQKAETYLNDAFGLRSYFVRINNQLAFSFFRKAKANGVIIGKRNYLYELNYIRAYYGQDFIGEDSIQHRMQRLKYIQDTLAKRNRHIIMVMAAGKGSFYPEYFPDKYQAMKEKTNLEYHLKYARELGINCIDFNRYFTENKQTASYPLYPRHGIHWSYYGTCLVADSLIRYIETLVGYPFAEVAFSDIKTEKSKGTDYDIADGMNLIFKLNREEMAYPEIDIKRDTSENGPSLLVISDSFYWILYGLGFQNAFSENHFWFYNKEVYPEQFSVPTEASTLSLRAEMARHDVVIILATEATLPAFGWNFIENAYELFAYNTPDPLPIDSETREKEILQIMSAIKNDEKWYQMVKEKAQGKKISVDSMLVLDAIWVLEQNRKSNPK